MSLQMTNLHSFRGLGSIPEFVYMYVCIYIHIFLSIHLLMATYRFSFYALVIVNNAAVNTGMHASFRVSEVFFRYMYPGVGLPWHMLVHFLRIFHIIFHNGCHNLHSHSQCTKVSSSPHPHQDFLFFLFFFFNHSSSAGYEMILHCAFGLHFSD